MKNKLRTLLCCAVFSGAVQHAGAAWYEDSKGYVVIELEHIVPTSDWVTRAVNYGTDSTMLGSKGDGWLEWTGAQFSGNTKPETGVTGILTYNFQIDTAGDYTVRFRQKQYSDVGAGDAGNDSWVQLKSGTPVSGMYDFSLFTKSWVQSKTVWSLKTSFEPVHGTHYVNDAVRRHYEAGMHTIQLAGRSPGHALDRMIICPVGTAEATMEGWSESRYDAPVNFLYFDATEDFPVINAGEVPYYVDATRDALAINAANTAYRGKFARAETTYSGSAGTYDFTIKTITELDGESTYNLLINDVQVATHQNPRVDSAGDMQEHLHTWSGIVLNTGDKISVESDCASNGLIPEGTGFAWSRGRWKDLTLKTSTGPTPESAVCETPNAGIYGEEDGSGNFKKWHRVTVAFEGPNTSEAATPNPFLNYRLDVTFTHTGGKTYTVPGYYAADGNAGETSADSGNIWRVHFAPDELGSWSYTASFRTGTNVSVDDNPLAGSSAGYFDGANGSFNVVASDKGGLDMRGKGRLVYDQTRYLYHAETGERFIKTGADAPEGFLGYEGFDNTYNTRTDRNCMKTWSPHEADWKAGDGGWKGTGKGILGAINYLASEEMNVFSFLTYSSGGDTGTVWPHRTHGDRSRYDCSKLDQWEVVFTHGDKMGMYLHFKTQETENDNHATWGHDAGAVATERKLYYRELVARFSHHMALNWNLGEENNQTEEQQKAMAQYFHDHDPYGHNIVLHTYPGEHYRYDWHLGSASELTGTSIQVNQDQVHTTTLKLLRDSVASGKPWVIANDEQGPALTANPPDWQADLSPTQEDSRNHVIWGNLMAGGAGVELYFGYDRDDNDLFSEDYRSRDRLWDYCRHAKHFFKSYLPFWEMQSADALIGNSAENNSKYCFAKAGEIYAVYLPDGGTTTLNLSGASGTFPVTWFNPREGGALQVGTVSSVTGGSTVSLGNAPSETSMDWAVLIGAAVDAGPDQSKMQPENTNVVTVALNGTVVMGAESYTVTWSKVSGDGTVVFADANAEDTSVTITGDPGVFELQLTATSASRTISSTMIITVTPYQKIVVNVPPEFTVDPMTRTNGIVGLEYYDTIAGSATDANSNNVISYAKAAGPVWLEVAANGELSGVPTWADAGNNSFTVRASDNKGASSTATLNIFIEAFGTPPAVSYGTGFTSGEGYVDGNLNNHSDWICERNPMVVDAAGIGWAYTDTGYRNHAFQKSLPYVQEAFEVSMDFAFSMGVMAPNIWGKPVMNIGLYGSGSPTTAEKLKASINRTGDGELFINLEETGWYKQLGLRSTGISPDLCGFDMDGGDTNSALLRMTCVFTRGETLADWTMHTKLYNLDTDPQATNALINYVQTGITHTNLFNATSLYAGFGEGQSDANALVSARRLDTFSFRGLKRVDAGPSQTVMYPENTNSVVIVLDGSVFVDESYTVQWSAVQAPGSVVFADASSEDTTVTISGEAGLYELQLAASFGGSVISNSMLVLVQPYDVPVGNVAPKFTSDSMTRGNAAVNMAYSATIAGTATDRNPGDTLTYSKSAGPDWLQVGVDGALSGKPEYFDRGSNAFTVQVRDAEGLTDSAQLTIVVETAGTTPDADYEIDFIDAEGYTNGALSAFADWSCQKNPQVADAAGTGWALLDDGYGNNAFIGRGFPASQDAFEVSMDFSFDVATTTAGKPIMNVGFYGAPSFAAEKLKASLRRNGDASFNIELETTGWFATIGKSSPTVTAADVGLNIAGGDTNSALLRLVATLLRGETESDWTMICKLYNLDSSALVPIIDYTATGVTHVNLYAAETIYGGFGGGQADWNALVSARKLDRFGFKGLGASHTAWSDFVYRASLSGLAGTDSDGDGQSDLYEFAMGGDSTNAAVLAGGVGLTYHSNDVVSLYHPVMAHDHPGIVYKVEWTTNILSGVWNSTWMGETNYPSVLSGFNEAEKQVWGGDKDSLFFKVEPTLQN